VIVRELITRLKYQVDERGAQQYERGFDALRSKAVGVIAAVTAVAAAIGTVVARAGDAVTSSMMKIESAIGRSATSGQEARDVYERLYDASLLTGVSANDSADAFARFNLAMRDLRRPASDTVDLIEGLQAAAITAGVRTQEFAGSMVQLGQALASGRLQGDEFRSLRENMPAFLRDVARELNVTMAQLMEQSEKGLLTPARLVPAMLNASRRARAELASAPLTMARAWVILRNSVTRFLADIDKATQLSRIMAHLFRRISQGAEWLRRALAPVGRMIGAVVERLGGAEAVSRVLYTMLAGLAVLIGGPLVAAFAAVVAAFAPWFLIFAIVEDFVTWVKDEDVDTLFGAWFGDFARVAQPFVDAWEWMKGAVSSATRWMIEEWRRFTHSDQMAETARILSAAAGLIMEAWAPVKQFFIDLWGGVTGAFSEAWDAIQPIIQAIQRAMAWMEDPLGRRRAAQGTGGEAPPGDGTGDRSAPRTPGAPMRPGSVPRGFGQRLPLYPDVLTANPSAGLEGRMPGAAVQNISIEAPVNISQTVQATGPGLGEIAAAAGAGVRQAGAAAGGMSEGAWGRAIAAANPRTEAATR